jgi:hypothetical protein
MKTTARQALTDEIIEMQTKQAKPEPKRKSNFANALYIVGTILFFSLGASCTREDSMGRLHFKRPNIHLFKHHR